MITRRSLSAIGGKQSYRLCGNVSRKGQPVQTAAQSIGTVPAVFRDVRVISTDRG